ncbi:MAG: glycosyltransferase family 9 protein [Chloroflexota bacterium]
MDRNALVMRNRAMAEAYHTTPFKHHIRRVMLYSLAALPIFPQRTARAAERILLIRPDHLGDMLLTTPAINALRRARPFAQIHALVGPWGAPVLETNEDLDAVVTLSFPGFNRSGNENLRSPYQMALRTARQLRRIGYTHAVILRPDHWWGAMVAFLAGIPLRIGYNLDDVAPFLTERIPFEHQHAVLQNMRLVQHWTGPVDPDTIPLTYTFEERDSGYARGYLEAWGLQPDDRYFCIHPGSGTWVKRWMAESWRSVAETLADQIQATPVFTGSDQELPLVREIVEGMTLKACIMAGDTTIGQLAAVFAGAVLVLGPDSGPLHLAAAVRTPTVGLFGPADPVEFRQWGPPEQHYILTSDIGCRPCRVLDWGGDDPANHPCLREITVGRVLDAARRATR